ncbi:putative Rossmann fold flavoprotein [Catalinimonas alkaloidigena]|uniref:NAD(P)/FAD-dependent oxidoreductase n=1 Tax=Catalinimonas alkaloidigena TaxID=1075417 RepID=UPI00240740FF|nr:NAD(P)/FAD-dependent oxidoreductase [Catalinimonas alkaloidigena]MDF9795728.1 putative Rossmann fold flavoprotein [Catalinimonas alkaloidigena]
MSKKIIVCGGGASGFFTAINIASKHPDYQLILLEKTNKVLSKVKISGGGRCNVTNARSKPSDLVKFYPRGQKKLHSIFKSFSTSDMVEWLDKSGVKTHTEADLRMFPVSNSSQTIIDCFMEAAHETGVEIRKNCGLTGFSQTKKGWKVETQQGETLEADALVIATGSAPSVWKILGKMGLAVEKAVPSLFTFNIKDSRLQGLSGMSFGDVSIRISGTKLEEQGPLLITHWGLSGPAVLKLSAWGARWMEEQKYRFNVQLNFLPTSNFEQFREELLSFKATHPGRKVKNFQKEEIPKRYWECILSFLDINPDLTFGELPNKMINKLTVEIMQAGFEVRGKSTFKEEFVTCGGVALAEVDLKTMEAKRFPGLYFSGEVLDIDALTGGFNFQSCWSTAWLISEMI